MRNSRPTTTMWRAFRMKGSPGDITVALCWGCSGARPNSSSSSSTRLRPASAVIGDKGRDDSGAIRGHQLGSLDHGVLKADRSIGRLLYYEKNTQLPR